MMRKIAVLSRTLNLLRIQQLWPGESEVARKNLRIRFFVTYTSVAAILVSIVVGHMYIVLKENRKVPLNDDYANLAALFAFYTVIAGFAWNYETLHGVLQKLSDFETFGMPDNFEKTEANLNFYSSLYSCYTWAGLSVYGVTRYVFDSECRRRNEELGYGEMCGALTPTWLPFDVDWFPARQTVVAALLVLFAVPLNSGATICFVVFEVSQHIGLRIRHLNRMLGELIETEGVESQRRLLKICCRYHSFIIAIHKNVDTCYKFISSAFIFVAAIVYAFIANQIAHGLEPGPIIFFCGCIVAMFIVCYAGQHVLSESESIAVAVYDTKWYQRSIRLQKDLSLIMMRAQAPLCLSAVFAGDLSLAMFITLMRATYSYLTFLRSNKTMLNV